MSRFGQAEVHYLEQAGTGHQNVGGLYVAVDDPRLVCGAQRGCDLPARNPGRAAATMHDFVNRDDVRVFQRRSRSRLVKETALPLFIADARSHHSHRDKPANSMSRAR
jgi:hypothetical protein